MSSASGMLGVALRAWHVTYNFFCSSTV